MTIQRINRLQWQKIESKFVYPLFVKPAVGGSSIGVMKAKDRVELENALEVVSLFDSKILVEKAIEGAREINISVMGNAGFDLSVSAYEEVFHSSEILSYEDKYKGDSSKSKGMASAKRKINPELSVELADKLIDTAKLVFTSLNCGGLTRIDFLVNEATSEIFVIEINTIPGSLAFYLWEASGVSFKEMLSRVIDLGFEKFEDAGRNTFAFSSNILENFSPSVKAPKF
jgi:D-alanine-D-alanine ligase